MQRQALHQDCAITSSKVFSDFSKSTSGSFMLLGPSSFHQNHAAPHTPCSRVGPLIGTIYLKLELFFLKLDIKYSPVLFIKTKGWSDVKTRLKGHTQQTVPKSGSGT